MRQCRLEAFAAAPVDLEDGIVTPSDSRVTNAELEHAAGRPPLSDLI
jgi:hypothetical protein